MRRKRFRVRRDGARNLRPSRESCAGRGKRSALATDGPIRLRRRSKLEERLADEVTGKFERKIWRQSETRSALSAADKEAWRV